jgi:hypothetical protein
MRKIGEAVGSSPVTPPNPAGGEIQKKTKAIRRTPAETLFPQAPALVDQVTCFP